MLCLSARSIPAGWSGGSTPASWSSKSIATPGGMDTVIYVRMYKIIHIVTNANTMEKSATPNQKPIPKPNEYGFLGMNVSFGQKASRQWGAPNSTLGKKSMKRETLDSCTSFF